MAVKKQARGKSGDKDMGKTGLSKAGSCPGKAYNASCRDVGKSHKDVAAGKKKLGKGGGGGFRKPRSA